VAISLDYRVFKLRTDYPKQIESLEGFFARQLTFQGWLLFSHFTTWRIWDRLLLLHQNYYLVNAATSVCSVQHFSLMHLQGQ